MMERRFYKAQALRNSAIESMCLTFETEIPSVPQEPFANAACYQADAKVLAACLLKVLPGGTLDQLIVELLQIKASHFRVSFNSEGIIP